MAVGNKFAYFVDRSGRQVTVGTLEDIEQMDLGRGQIYYCDSEQALLQGVKEYYHNECIITLRSPMNDFKENLSR